MLVPPSHETVAAIPQVRLESHPPCQPRLAQEFRRPAKRRHGRGIGEHPRVHVQQRALGMGALAPSGRPLLLSQSLAHERRQIRRSQNSRRGLDRARDVSFPDDQLDAARRRGGLGVRVSRHAEEH